MLAFFTTLACGIKIGDPQCGYTATSHVVLRKWNWKNLGRDMDIQIIGNQFSYESL